MPWFKVDDGFYDHPKVAAIPLKDRAAAAGAWLLCGTWSAKHLQDGFVPESRAHELAGDRIAALLVDVKLWRRVKGGYRFHDWATYQPTRAAVEERRKVRAAAGAKGGVSSGRTRRLRAVGEDEPLE